MSSQGELYNQAFQHLLVLDWPVEALHVNQPESWHFEPSYSTHKLDIPSESNDFVAEEPKSAPELAHPASASAAVSSPPAPRSSPSLRTSSNSTSSTSLPVRSSSTGVKSAASPVPFGVKRVQLLHNYLFTGGLDLHNSIVVYKLDHDAHVWAKLAVTKAPTAPTGIFRGAVVTKNHRKQFYQHRGHHGPLDKAANHEGSSQASDASNGAKDTLLIFTSNKSQGNSVRIRQAVEKDRSIRWKSIAKVDVGFPVSNFLHGAAVYSSETAAHLFGPSPKGDLTLLSFDIAHKSVVVHTFEGSPCVSPTYVIASPTDSAVVFLLGGLTPQNLAFNGILQVKLASLQFDAVNLKRLDGRQARKSGPQDHSMPDGTVSEALEILIDLLPDETPVIHGEPIGCFMIEKLLYLWTNLKPTTLQIVDLGTFRRTFPFVLLLIAELGWFAESGIVDSVENCNLPYTRMSAPQQTIQPQTGCFLVLGDNWRQFWKIEPYLVQRWVQATRERATLVDIDSTSQSTKPTLLAQVAERLPNRDASTDIKLVLYDKQVLWAHKFVLWSRAEFFAGILETDHPSRLRDPSLTTLLGRDPTDNVDVIKLPEGFGFEFDPVLAVLRYIYTGNIEFTSKEHLLKVNSVSVKFILPDLKTKLTGYVEASQSSEFSASSAKILSVYAGPKITFPKKVAIDRPELAFGRKALKPQLSDISFKIVSSKETIPAHRIILEASSPYFRGLFESRMSEHMSKELALDLEDVDSETFKAFLKYLYCLDFPTIKTKAINTAQLLYVADYYSQDDLMEACLSNLLERISSEVVSETFPTIRAFPRFETYIWRIVEWIDENLSLLSPAMVSDWPEELQSLLTLMMIDKKINFDEIATRPIESAVLLGMALPQLVSLDWWTVYDSTRAQVEKYLAMQKELALTTKKALLATKYLSTLEELQGQYEPTTTAAQMAERIVARKKLESKALLATSGAAIRELQCNPAKAAATVVFSASPHQSFLLNLLYPASSPWHDLQLFRLCRQVFTRLESEREAFKDLRFTATGGGVVNFLRYTLTRPSVKRYFRDTLGPVYKRIALAESLRVLDPEITRLKDPLAEGVVRSRRAQLCFQFAAEILSLLQRSVDSFPIVIRYVLKRLAEIQLKKPLEAWQSDASVSVVFNLFSDCLDISYHATFQERELANVSIVWSWIHFILNGYVQRLENLNLQAVNWLRSLVSCGDPEDFFQPNAMLPSVTHEPYIVDVSSLEASLILKKPMDELEYTSTVISQDFESLPLVKLEVTTVANGVINYLINHPMSIKPDRCASLDGLLFAIRDQLTVQDPLKKQITDLHALSGVSYGVMKECFTRINQLAYSLIRTPQQAIVKLTPPKSKFQLIRQRYEVVSLESRRFPVFNTASKKKLADKTNLKDLLKKFVITEDNPYYATKSNEGKLTITVVANGEFKFEVASSKTLPAIAATVEFSDLLSKRDQGLRTLVIANIQFDLERLILWLNKNLPK